MCGIGLVTFGDNLGLPLLCATFIVLVVLYFLVTLTTSLFQLAGR